MGIFHKDGCYWIDYYHKGRRFREKIGTSKRQAEKAYSVRRSQVANDTFFESMIKHIQFGKFSGHVLEWYDSHRPKSAMRVRAAMNHLVPHFGNQTMDEITKAHVEAYIDKRKVEVIKKRERQGRKGEGDHFAVINREVVYLKKSFSIAIERNHAKMNPCKGIRAEKERARVRFFEGDEEHRILAECPPQMVRVVIFACNTGCRLSEITALRWRDVDLSRRFITIVEPKNRKDRKIPINARVVKILQGLKDDGPHVEYVFTDSQGRPYKSNAVSQNFARSAKRSGVKDFRFHDLRHEFASGLALRGTPPMAIARLLGVNIKMVDRYAHLTDKFLQSHVDLLMEPIKAPSVQHMDTIWSPEGVFTSENTSTKPTKPLN